VRAHRALPVAARGEQQPRTQDVADRGAELGGGSERASERFLGLRVRVTAAAGSGAADRDVRPDPHRAGVGGGFLEAAALPVVRPQLPSL